MRCGESQEGRCRHSLQCFGIAQITLVLSRMGLRPPAPCPGVAKAVERLEGKGGEEKWRGCHPPECPLLLGVILALCPCTNRATRSETALPSSLYYYETFVGGSANIMTKRVILSPFPKPRGQNHAGTEQKCCSKPTAKAAATSRDAQQSHAGSTSQSELKFRTALRPNSSPACHQCQRREVKQVPMFGWGGPTPEPQNQPPGSPAAGHEPHISDSRRQDVITPRGQALHHKCLATKKAKFSCMRGTHARSHTHTHTHTEPR